AARAPQSRFQSRRAVAFAAGPRLAAVFIAAAVTSVSVLDLDEIDELFPIGPFFFERRRTVADFNPANRAVLGSSRGVHVTQIFVARHGTLSEGFIVDSAK